MEKSVHMAVLSCPVLTAGLKHLCYINTLKRLFGILCQRIWPTTQHSLSTLWMDVTITIMFIQSSYTKENQEFT